MLKMKLAFNLFLFIFALSVFECSCQNVCLIGSRYASNDSAYKAYLLTYGLEKADGIDVSFGTKGGQQTVLRESELIPFKELHFDVPKDSNSYELRISSNIENQCKQQSVDIFKASEAPIIFIQFNKPVYKINEAFQFRVFVLTQKLLPYPNFGQMNITIFSPKGNILWNDKKVSQISDYGVYEKSLNVQELKSLGILTLQVEVDGRKISKSFEVQQQNAGDAEVFLQAPTEVAFEDRKIYLNIFTKNPRGKAATIFMTARFVGSNKEEIGKQVKSLKLTEPKTNVMLDFKDDLGIQFPTNDMILKFTIQTSQGSSATTVFKEVKMRHKGKNTIQVMRKKFFKPGFKFPIKIRVKLLDGKPDNSFNQLSTTVKYISMSKNGKSNVDEKSYTTNLKNGDAVLNLQPKSKTTKIQVLLKFAETEYTEEIDKFPGADEFMQVSMVKKSTAIGTEAKFQVQSTHEMELPHLIVFGTKGIVHSENFPDAIGKDLFTFSLELTDDMRPEARGLVFYTRNDDGAMIYDEFSLSIGFSIDNSLEITAPETAEPNQLVNIDVKTEKDSQVFLVIIDANSELLNSDNEVSRSSVYDELTYYVNRKFPTTSEHHFEKLNIFVLDPVKNGSDCIEETNGNRNIEKVQASLTTLQAANKYFPEVLAEFNYKATTNDAQSLKVKVPDSTTKWKIYGISIHPTKGFTVSKTNPVISVTGSAKKNLEVEFIGPSKVHPNEVHKVQMIVKNWQQGHSSQIVTVNIENGMILGEVTDQKSWSLNCRRYFVGKVPLKINFQFTPQISEDTKYFFIKSNGVKPIKLTAMLQSEIDSTLEVPVENSDSSTKEVIASNLIELNQRNPVFELKLQRNAAAVKTFVDVYGNLLGPALDGLESVFGRPMLLNEEKILKLSTSTMNYKFLESIGQSESQQAKTALKDITESGHESQKILKMISNDKSKLSLMSLTIGALMDARSYLTVDQKLLSDSLYFIGINQRVKNSQFGISGSFIYNQDTDDRKDIGAGMREYIQNALIIAAFSKDENIKQQYKFIIDNSMNYLWSEKGKFNGDIVNVIVAYAFVLHARFQQADELISKLNHGYKKPETPSTKKHQSMYVEVLSYLILTKIQLNQDPRTEVEWLLSHRKADGRFYSPYDTTLALQALYEYTNYRKTGKSFVFELDNQQNMIAQHEFKHFGPFEGTDNNLMVTTQGLGYTSVYREYESSNPPINSISTLKIYVQRIPNSNDLQITFDYLFNPFDRAMNGNLMVLEVEIPKGYDAIGPKSNNIEFIQNGSTGFFYIYNVQKGVSTKSAMRLTKNSGTEYYEPLNIQFYDYYRPNIKDTYTYDLLCIHS